MEIELATASEVAPLEFLDLQVSSRRSVDQSLLSVKVLCRQNRYIRQLQIPTLTWFDANRLQRFSREIIAASQSQSFQTDLMDAGLRLTGTVRRQAGRGASERTIQVEPLPSASNQFSAFSIHTSCNDIRAYATKLHSRLWEVFTRG
ncbi:hypothetical protein GCM10028807_41180 [Spirosoma daeguense]